MKECSSNNSTSGASDHTDGDNDQDRDDGVGHIYRFYCNERGHYRNAVKEGRQGASLMLISPTYEVREIGRAS